MSLYQIIYNVRLHWLNTFAETKMEKCIILNYPSALPWARTILVLNCVIEIIPLDM